MGQLEAGQREKGTLGLPTAAFPRLSLKTEEKQNTLIVHRPSTGAAERQSSVNEGGFPLKLLLLHLLLREM